VSGSYRIALLNHAGEWLEYMAQSFRDLGHEAQVFTVHEDKDPSIDSTIQFLKNFKPDFCFVENFHVFDPIRAQLSLPLENYLAEQKIPTAVWYVDSPSSTGSFLAHDRWIKGYSPDLMTFLCIDRHDLEFFKKRSLPASHVCLGVDKAWQHYEISSDLRKKYSMPLSYIGAPTRNPAPAKNKQELLENYMIGFLQFFMQNLQKAQESAHAFKPAIFQKMTEQLVPYFQKFYEGDYLDPRKYHEARDKLENQAREIIPSGLLSFWSFFREALTVSYSHFQLAFYLNEITSFGLKVYGGEEWKEVLFHKPEVFPRIPQAELPALFASSKINFCLTKWHFWGAVQERAFWVLGAGGFPLVDRREELYDLFEKDEIASYSSLEECKDLIQYYLKNEDQRLKMLSKGREKVFAKYTYDHCMAKVVKVMEEHWQL
jgi:hypothetical protein